MKLTSPAFGAEQPIPREYTCDGGNLRPELRIEDAPADARSFALIMDDPDAPGGTFTHWLIWNVPGDTKTIIAGELLEGALEGKTDFGSTKYGGPCPPSGIPHRYFFRLFALDGMLTLKSGASREQLEPEIEKHLLEKAELMGTYQR